MYVNINGRVFPHHISHVRRRLRTTAAELGSRVDCVGSSADVSEEEETVADVSDHESENEATFAYEADENPSEVTVHEDENEATFAYEANTSDGTVTRSGRHSKPPSRF